MSPTIVVVLAQHPASGAEDQVDHTTTRLLLIGHQPNEDALDEPLMVTLGSIERRCQSARMMPAVCTSNGTQRHPYCLPIGGPVGFDSQRQRNRPTPMRSRLALPKFLLFGTHQKAHVRSAAAVWCLHTAVALELSAGQVCAAGKNRNLRPLPASRCGSMTLGVQL
jgi:hypothetical protein